MFDKHVFFFILSKITISYKEIKPVLNFQEYRLYFSLKKAEMEGFEPSRRLPDLPHFECGPFSHLGTSPNLKQNVLTMFHYIVRSRKGQFFFCREKNLLLTRKQSYNMI